MTDKSTNLEEVVCLVEALYSKDAEQVKDGKPEIVKVVGEDREVPKVASLSFPEDDLFLQYLRSRGLSNVIDEYQEAISRISEKKQPFQIDSRGCERQPTSQLDIESNVAENASVAGDEGGSQVSSNREPLSTPDNNSQTYPMTAQRIVDTS